MKRQIVSLRRLFICAILILLLSLQMAKALSPSSLIPSRNVIQSFTANPFVARSGLFGISAINHIQTIFGSGALEQKFWPPKRYFTVTAERLTTPDGDFLDVEFAGTRNTQGQTVVIMHGLESNTKGPLVNNMATGISSSADFFADVHDSLPSFTMVPLPEFRYFMTAFLSKGFSVCLVSLRGCSGEPNRTPGAYHIGMTRDIDFVCKIIQERKPDESLLPTCDSYTYFLHTPERIYLSGFSLGGNVILKYLGELSHSAKERNIYGAAVYCVPFDCVATQKKLDGGTFSRMIYSNNFLRSLKAKARIQHKMFPTAFDIDAINRCTTIGDFDDAYIAPIYGFKDKMDYYIQSSSKQYLRNITVPALAINALDDPFIDEYSLPSVAEDVGDAPVRLIYHAQGGHCGFDADTSRSYVHGPVEPPAHGWIAEELSRFFDHIHQDTKSTGAMTTADSIGGVTMKDDKSSSLTPTVFSSSSSSFMSSLFPTVTTAEPSVISTLFSSISSKEPSAGGSNRNDIHQWFGGLTSPSVQRFRPSLLIQHENEQSNNDTWSWTDNK